MRLARSALITAAAIASAPTVAAAERPSSAQVYALTSVEAGFVGMFAMAFGTDLGDGVVIPAGMAMTLAAPAAIGYGAHRLRLDPAPMLALHGAAWYGTDLLMLGSLIEGRDQAWGLHAGKLAWSMAGVGALAGAVLGWREVDTSAESYLWLGAPVGGFVAGGLFLGGFLVLIGGVDGDTASGQFATGATVGLTLGLGAATVMALRGFEDRPSPKLARLARWAPRVALDHDRLQLSVSGRF